MALRKNTRRLRLRDAVRLPGPAASREANDAARYDEGVTMAADGDTVVAPVAGPLNAGRRAERWARLRPRGLVAASSTSGLALVAQAGLRVASLATLAAGLGPAGQGE